MIAAMEREQSRPGRSAFMRPGATTVNRDPVRPRAPERGNGGRRPAPRRPRPRARCTREAYAGSPKDTRHHLISWWYRNASVWPPSPLGQREPLQPPPPIRCPYPGKVRATEVVYEGAGL